MNQLIKIIIFGNFTLQSFYQLELSQSSINAVYAAWQYLKELYEPQKKIVVSLNLA